MIVTVKTVGNINRFTSNFIMLKSESELNGKFNFLEWSQSLQQSSRKSATSKKPEYKKMKKHLKLNKKKINSNFSANETRSNIKNATAPPPIHLKFDWKKSTKHSLKNTDYWTNGNQSNLMDSMSINFQLGTQNEQVSGKDTCFSGKLYKFPNSLSRFSEKSLEKRDSDNFFNSYLNKKKLKKKIKNKSVLNFRNGVKTSLHKNPPEFFTFEEILKGPQSLILTKTKNWESYNGNPELILEIKESENILNLNESNREENSLKKKSTNKFFEKNLNLTESKRKQKNGEEAPNQENSEMTVEILPNFRKPPTFEHLEQNQCKRTLNKQMQNKKKLFIKMNLPTNIFYKERMVNSNQMPSIQRNDDVSPKIDSLAHFQSANRENFFKTPPEGPESTNEISRSIPHSTCKTNSSFFPEKSMEQLKNFYLKNSNKLNIGLKIQINKQNQNPNQYKLLENLKTIFEDSEAGFHNVKVNLLLAPPLEKRVRLDHQVDFKSFYLQLQTTSPDQLLRDLRFFRNYNLVLHNCYFTKSEIAERIQQARNVLKSFLKNFLVRNLSQENNQIQKINEIVYKLFFLHLRVPNKLFYSIDSIRRSFIFVDFFFKMFNKKMVNDLIYAKASKIAVSLGYLFSEEIRLGHHPKLLARMYLMMQLVRRMISNFHSIFNQDFIPNVNETVSRELDIGKIVEDLDEPKLSFDELVDSVNLDEFQDFFIFIKHTNFNPKKLYQVNRQISRNGFKVFYYPHTNKTGLGSCESKGNSEFGQERVSDPKFVILSKATMKFNQFRKVKKNVELYKKIQRNLNKIIGNCLNLERNPNKLASLEIHKIGQVPSQEVKFHFKISRKEFETLQKQKRVKGKLGKKASLDRVNEQIQKMLEDNINQPLLSAIKCTDLFQLYKEQVLGAKYLEKQVASILEVDFFKLSCLRHFELKEEFFTSVEKFISPWSIFESLSLVKMYETIEKKLLLEKLFKKEK